MSETCPPDPLPEDRVSRVSDLCGSGMRPHVLTGFLRQLLTTHFTDPDNIEDLKLRQKLKEIGGWKPNNNGLSDSGILIESITRWAPNEADKRPAVIIKRNNWQWQKIAIGDLTATNYIDGSKSYTGLWQGSHTLYCLSLSGVETELVTMEVVRYLQHFGPWIREQMNFKRFMISEVGGISEVQEVVQGYAVPVTLAYVAEESWSLQPAAPRLKRLVLKASDLFAC
jgi:hypothetical protein